jgi:hypothetical protein
LISRTTLIAYSDVEYSRQRKTQFTARLRNTIVFGTTCRTALHQGVVKSPLIVDLTRLIASLQIHLIILFIKLRNSRGRVLSCNGWRKVFNLLRVLSLVERHAENKAGNQYMRSPCSAKFAVRQRYIPDSVHLLNRLIENGLEVSVRTKGF